MFLGRHMGPTGVAIQVVLKRVRSEFSHVPELRALLVSEAALQARLVHPNIVRTWDLVVLEDEHYLVMEYVRGGDLELLVRRAKRRGRRFSYAAALFIARELLFALEYAHELRDELGLPLQLVHRDVSLGNVLVSAEGEVKLADFGIAATDVKAPGLRLRGKIGYMSPEQARQEELDLRSDLFSLATVLYELLTGKRLFVGHEGDSPTRVYATPIVPPSTLCPGLPPAIDRVILRALSLDKSDRPKTARAFYEEILVFGRQHGLLLDRAELRDELRGLLGEDPDTWRVVEERSGTAQIPSLLEDDAVWDDPVFSMPMSIAQSLAFSSQNSETAPSASEVTAPLPEPLPGTLADWPAAVVQTLSPTETQPSQRLCVRSGFRLLPLLIGVVALGLLLALAATWFWLHRG